MAIDGSLYHTEAVNEKGLSGVSFIRGNEGLALGVSSSLVKGSGTNPEQLVGLAISTCFNATIQIIEQQHHLPHTSVVQTGVDQLKDETGYKFVVRVQVMMTGVDRDQAQSLVDEAKNYCPVAKMIKQNANVSFEVVDEFSF
ncbi:OsmC/Ohr family protein [Secundilactobacillus pentosiphilus]|uniref:OsmC/Ohr family protein n=1 Tax=Secundilactobacillus pentosiphilus TaxID=1714682 RepID=A0A1Z5INJ6_9LACO|nr:OsmC family protein [Secundilactobacillus pentosiphilus]GAX03334.1 OsmC/Ohr family protein [Secundilactobacillus pentosiphilus]